MVSQFGSVHNSWNFKGGVAFLKYSQNIFEFYILQGEE
jgi:hypothetical protein